MKIKYILMLVFIMLLPSTFALYGGDTWTYYFDECKTEIQVNITGTEIISEGEYIILNDCIENETNFWKCSCNNYFNITFKEKNLNNYTLIFNYDYQKEESVSSSSGGGSSGSTSSCNTKSRINSTYCKIYCTKYIKTNDCTESYYSKKLCCINYYKEIDNIIFKEPIVKDKVIEQELNITDIHTPIENNITGEEEEPTETETKINKGFILFLIILFLIAVAGIINEIIKRRKKEVEIKNNTND